MENSAGEKLLSKLATNGGHGENSPFFDGWKAYDRDPYHPTGNPEGIIQMGLAENQLCHDLIEDWMLKHPEASFCTPEGISNFKSLANFQDYHGLPSFRHAVAKFMEKERGGLVKFDPDRIVMSGGATGAIETLASCLADPGDAFLIPAPYYPGYDRDFCWRTKAHLIPIPCDSSTNFQLTLPALHSAYTAALQSHTPIKGLLLSNPSNPLATAIPPSTLLALLHFSTTHRLHLIVDEVYAATTSPSPPSFTSISHLLLSHPRSFDPSLVHLVSSLSKNLGLPGLRVGLIYSYNDNVVACARAMSSFNLVSTQTQHLLARLLADDDFSDRYLAANVRRIRDRREAFVGGIRGVGVRVLEANAGLFCWMDLRAFLKEDSLEGELELWRVILRDVKLNVSPGSSFHCEEMGWFRACFSNMDDGTTEEALRRIRVFVDREKMVRRKMRYLDGGLRLSLPRRYEESAVMSPRSPLVHANS